MVVESIAVVGIIQLVNMIFMLALIGIVVFGFVVLLKLNKALDIWIKKNE